MIVRHRLRIFEHLTCSTALLLLVSGCATPGKSMGAGALLGGVAGAGVGLLADPGKGGAHRLRNVVIGTAVGGAVGGGTGWAVNQAIQNEKQEAYGQGQKDAVAGAEEHAASATGSPPKLLPARTEARWVPDQVHGVTFVPGHFEYLIIENAHWERVQ